MEPSKESIAVLRRLREMLGRQREKFGRYLVLVEQEQISIETKDAQRLLAQVEMERGLIDEIYALQRVIGPLEDLYASAYPRGEQTVPALRAVLEAMATEIRDRNQRNCTLLARRVEELRQEIAALHGWPRTRSPFVQTTPGFIDVRT